MRAVCLALLALASLHCGNTSPQTSKPLPERPSTPGDNLLAAAPLGADLLLEVDLARLRDNEVVGSVLKVLSAPGGQSTLAKGDVLGQGRSLLVCVYGIGDLAKQLLLVEAMEGVELSGAAPIRQGLYAVGDPELISRAVALRGSGGASMLEDIELLRMRAEVMPAGAKHAAVRAVARLNFDARVAVASRVGMSEVPVALALWGDVVDDLAIVARVTGETEDSHQRLARALLTLRKQITKAPLVRHLGLAPALAAARLSRLGATVQLVFVLSPKRLKFAAQRLVQQLQSIQPSASHD